MNSTDLQRSIIKILLLAAGVFVASLITCALVSIWYPLAFGRELWWNMATGKLERRVFLAGLEISRSEMLSGTEPLFEQEQQNPLEGEILLPVYRGSFIQRFQGVDRNAYLLSMTRMIVDVTPFYNIIETNLTMRTNIIECVRRQDADQLDFYIKQLDEIVSPRQSPTEFQPHAQTNAEVVPRK